MRARSTGHSGGSDECIGCIRGRLAVLGEHDREVMNHESFARSFGRAADRKVYGPSVVPCLECGAPGVYHATHCGHYQVSQEGGLHGGPEPYRGECGQQSFDAWAMPSGWCRLEKGHLGSHWRPVPTLGMVGQRIKEESAKSGRQHRADMALRVDGQALVIGRIVRYRTVGEPGQTWAALVTRVPSVNPPSGRVDLLLFAPVGGPVVCGDVGYDAGGSRGTWHWPPKVAA